jgi:peptide/nickel transport system substrate-binding protein
MLVVVALALIAAACTSDNEPAPADTGAIASAVQDAVAEALKAAPAAPAPVTAAEIQSLVSGAVSGIPAPEIPDQVSASELQAMVESAIAASAAQATEPLSAEDINSMVEAALAAATSGSATKEDIEGLIAQAVEASGEAAVSAAQAAAAAEAAAETVYQVVAQQTAAAEATPTPTFAQSEIKTGGTLRVVMPTDSNTLDPALSLSTIDNATTMQSYNNLILRMEDLSLEPHLTTSWTPSSDLTSYEFKLREGVKFVHGKEMKAEDVVFTFKRILDKDTGSPARSALDFITGINALDEYTVTIDMSGANAFLPDTLSLYQGRIIPSDIDPDRLATEMFGTGPFSLTESRPNELVAYDRNVDYWDAGKPYLNKLAIFYMPEPVTRNEALKSGQVDVQFPLDAANVSGTESAQGAVVLETASSAYLNLSMDVRVPPFNDIQVRQAIQAATDRETIRQVALFGRGAIANDHPIPPNDPHYDDSVEVPQYDVAKAKQLLADAGFADGLDITLHTSTITPGMVEMAVALKESAAPAGINISIERAPEDKYWASVWMTEPFTTVGWNGRNPDQAFSIVYKSDADWNEAFWVNTRADELMIQARGQANLEDRKATYGELQALVVEEVPRIIPVFTPRFIGVRDNVRGIASHPSSWILLHKAWLDD